MKREEADRRGSVPPEETSDTARRARLARAEMLLGGYAAGTLTPEERQALFAAALEDQQLYDALAREEPLRELLSDPAARSTLLVALGEVPQPWYCRDVPAAVIAGALAAMVTITLAVKFWPVRSVPLVTVVARGDLPQAVRSPLPTDIRPFLPELPRRVPPPALPPAPVLPAPPGVRSPASAEALLAPLASAPLPTRAQERRVRAAVSSFVPSGAAFLPAGRAAPLRLNYRLFRKLPDGALSEIDPETELQPGDETVIRLEPSDSGFLYLMERTLQDGWRPVATVRVESGTSYTFPKEGVFRADPAGPREFQAVLSRTAQILPPKGAAVLNLVPVDAQAAQQVALRITLRYKK
jgi:hypothetical protein